MKKAIKKAETILSNAGISEFKQEARYIACIVSGLSLEDILLEKEVENKQEITDKIINFANLRAETLKPIQYILNRAYFMNELYYVNENVLIPRVETELLVLKAFEKLKDRDNSEKIDILDIGTGSGCIALELAKKLKNKNIEILAVDNSTEAIQTALVNLERFDLIRLVLFRKSDLFSKIRDVEKFDLIVSNPPYIPIQDKPEIQKEVLFEPENALFSNDEKGIDFYRKITLDAPKYLKKGGYLAYEIGFNQCKDVKKFLEKDFCNIEVFKDLSGIDRVIIAKLK